MAENVVRIKTERSVCEKTVKQLRWALEQAEKGVIQSVFVVSLDAGGISSKTCSMAPGSSDWAIIGAIEYWQQGLIRHKEVIHD